jgi:branched-chain amino acid transport system ATP-binding protein
MTVLRITELDTGYGDIQALKGLSLSVEEGEVVALLGANGAGKTTLLRSMSGLLPAWAGTIEFQGEPVERVRASRRARLGIAHVPEGRQVFAPLTVAENLDVGALADARRPAAGEVGDRIKGVYTLFPRLGERNGQLAGTLSGGEQQMLAIGRALMSEPKLLMLDEPSLGLAPQVTDTIFDALAELKREGMTILLAEQNAAAALDVADRGYVLELGRIAHSGTSAELGDDKTMRNAYFGVHERGVPA